MTCHFRHGFVGNEGNHTGQSVDGLSVPGFNLVFSVLPTGVIMTLLFTKYTKAPDARA